MSVAPATALELDLLSAPAHSFLGLGGATPAHLRVDVRDIDDSWGDLAAYFATQLPSSSGLTTPSSSAGCTAAEAAELEALLYGVYRRVMTTLCGTKRLEVGDSVLAPHDYSFLSSFSTRDGTEFKDTRVFSLYRALSLSTLTASRRIDKPNYILYAEVTEGDDVWSVGEGMGEVVLGPRRADVERWLDAHAWAKVRDSGREAEVMAALTERQRARGQCITMHAGGRVPEGIARDMSIENYRYDLAMATRTFRDFMARTGIAHSLFHLLAANEMCGAVLAWAIVGHKLVRMYVLGPSRIAIELAPPSCHRSTSPYIPPHERVGIPFAALETGRAFDRLPHSFLAPEDPSIFPPGPRINPGAVQAFANVAAASILRLGALDCTQALSPLPMTKQHRVASDMVEALKSLTPLPPELCRYVVELSRGPTLRRILDSRNGNGGGASFQESPAATDRGECEMGAECCQNTGSANMGSALGLGLGLGLGPGVELAPPPSVTTSEAGPSQRKRRASEAVEGIERAVARARTPVSTDVADGHRSPMDIPFETPVPEPVELGEDEPRQMDEHDHDHMPPIDPTVRVGGTGIDWTALDQTLNRLAVFVPVTPREMDALVATEIRDNLGVYAPQTFTASPKGMEQDHSAEVHDEEEDDSFEVPTRTLADEYDSDSESDIVD